VVNEAFEQLRGEEIKMDIGKDVTFTLHAEDKLKRLTKLGVTKENVIGFLRHPGTVVSGYYGRKIAHVYLKEDLILRIVYEESEQEITVVTVYPGERSRYE
jgi:hypothetical protein